MQKTQTLLLILFISIFLSVKGGASSVKIAVPIKLENVDPVLMWSTSEMILTSAYCRPLTRLNQRGTIEGELVKSWSVSESFREYRFVLRDNVRFHEGSNLTSSDVVNSLSRHFWDKYNSGYRHHIAFFTGNSKKIKSGKILDNFEVVNEKIFKIKTEKPYLPLLKMLSQTGLCITKKGDPLIGTGPMVVKKHPSGNGWVLKKFDLYSGSPSRVSEVYVFSEYDPIRAQMHIKTGQLDIALGSLFADSESLPIEQRKLLDMVSINHFLINHRSDPFSDKNIRQAFGELLQSVAWKPNNIPWNQRKSTSLVPTGFFSVASSQNKLSIEKSAQALKKVRGSFKTPVKIALIGKHFSSKFLLDLEKVLINIDIPFNLINLEPSEWNLNKTSGNFDITHLPMQPSFYDPDGIFITLKNYYPENLQYLFKNMSNYRNITNKKKRIHGYVKGLRQIENAWILVPTYRKYVPYLASDEIQFPQTKFLNEIAVWKIRKSNRGINDSKDR